MAAHLLRSAAVIASEITRPAPDQAKAAIELLDEGATVPFIARYRKEVTGGLDDTQLRTAGRAARLSARTGSAPRHDRSNRSAGQGKLTDELKAKIAAAPTKAELEDIYLPYKPKRRTRAEIARERGLGPLAEAILADRAQGACRAGGSLRHRRGAGREGGARRRARYRRRRPCRKCRPARPAARPYAASAPCCVPRWSTASRQAGEKFSDYFDHSERWATGAGPPRAGHAARLERGSADASTIEVDADDRLADQAGRADDRRRLRDRATAAPAITG